KGCVAAVQNYKSVIWKPHRALAAVLLDKLCNNNLIFEQFRKRVFGLGNKTYEHYNKVAMYVDKRLEELGATRVFELGLGDDDANIEDDFITWKDRFWPAVCDFFGIEGGGEEVLIRPIPFIGTTRRTA
ncbi:hypothetical protein DOY81_014267, partial [Sarcophaga bullata]